MRWQRPKLLKRVSITLICVAKAVKRIEHQTSAPWYLVSFPLNISARSTTPSQHVRRQPEDSTGMVLQAITTATLVYWLRLHMARQLTHAAAPSASYISFLLFRCCHAVRSLRPPSHSWLLQQHVYTLVCPLPEMHERAVLRMHASNSKLGVLTCTRLTSCCQIWMVPLAWKQRA
jgi:hypothetical protein